MPLESVNFIEDMNAAWPTGTDPKNEGDNHMRNIKNGILSSFPNTSGIWTTTNKITMGGADMTGAKVENVAAPTAGTDAVNNDTLLARVPGHISWGIIGSAGGAPVNNPGSGDFTVIKGTVGRYTLTFTRPVSGGLNGNLGFSCIGDGITDIRAMIETDANLVSVHVTLRAGNGSLTDNTFHFIRIVA